MFRISRTHFHALLVSVSVLPSAAIAAETEERDTIVVTGAREKPYAVDSTVSATKTDAPIMKVPQIVNVVPEQVLLDQQVQSMTEALRNVSGITQTNGAFFADTLKIRGFGTDGAILRDGYTTIQEHALGSTVERIEVLKGPASLLYGRFEPGGLVNVITKKPQQTFGFDVSTQLSSRGQRRLVGDITGPVGGGVAFRLVAEVEDSEYWRNVGRDKETVFIAPSLSFSSGSFSLLAQYEYLDTVRPFDRGRIYFNGKRLDTPATRSFAEDFAELAQKIHSGSLTLGYAFDPDWRVEAKLAIQRGTGGDFQIRPRRLVLDAQGVPTGEFIRSVDGNRDTFDDRDYISATVHGKFETGGLRHTLLLGADYEKYDSGRGFSFGSPNTGGFDIYDPVYGLLDQSFAGLTLNPNSDSLQTFKTFGLYAQDLIEIGDQWTLVLGGRYEKYEDFQISGAAINQPSDDSSGDTILPRAGIVFQPRPNISIYASYSRSFAPNASVPAIGDQPASGPFPPEKGRSYELGVKAQIFSGLTATAAVYDIKKQNVLVTRDLGNGISITEARDKITSRGFEFDMVGEITPNLSVIASYAYTDASDPQSALGDNVQDVAKHTASLSATYRLTESVPGLSLGAGVFHTGRRYGGQSAGADAQASIPFFMPGFTTLDLNAGYEMTLPSDHVVYTRLTLRNATNVDYDQSSGSALRVAPGQARTLYGTVGVRF
jgi:iron complex outermembrane receptor protein